MELLLVFFVLLLGFVFHKFKIKLFVKNLDFELCIKFYIFYFIRIFVIKIKNKKIIINGIELRLKIDVKNIKLKQTIKILKNYLNAVKIKKANTYIEYSILDSKFTAESYGLLCFALNLVSNSNFSFKLIPKFYNYNFFILRNETVFNINIIKLLVNNNCEKDNNKNKKEIIKYGKSTSNRSSYGNSYE